MGKMHDCSPARAGTQPVLSIVTVTLNAESVIRDTLDSILGQGFDDYEIIIIDGASTDNTMEIISGYKDKLSVVVSEPDNGIYNAMNKGMRAASGKYIQFLNAGDYYCDNDVLSDVFENARDEDLLYGDINIQLLNGETCYQKADPFDLQALQSRGTGVLCHQAMFVKREISPAYDERYVFKGELNWYFDLVEISGFSYRHIARPIVNYTLGGFGYKHFIRNRLEWVRLLYRRYGIRTVYESGIIPFLLKNSLSRYPVLRKAVKVFQYPFSLFKRK